LLFCRGVGLRGFGAVLVDVAVVVEAGNLVVMGDSLVSDMF
jgi:hypothetical protein